MLAAASALGLCLVGGAAPVCADPEAGAAADRAERRRAAYAGELPLAGTPDLGKRSERLAALGIPEGAPILIRIFKHESELELWMQKGSAFVLFATYPVCSWDGLLGPKMSEGDRQSPEGFYTVSERQLRWTGRWYRGFDLSFPNAFDRAKDRTGSAILIHGGCSSVGCFAMTNRVMDELFDLGVSALAYGQGRFQVQVFPFRLTPANLERFKASPWVGFWKRLKEGYDLFEATRIPPEVDVCKADYRFRAGAAGSVGARSVTSVCMPPAPAATLPDGWAAALERTRLAAAPPVVAPKPKSSLLERLALAGEIVPGDVAPRRSRRGVITGSVPVAGTPSIAVRCNPGLPSCRRWIALKKKAVRRAVVSKPAAAKAGKKKQRLAKR